MNESEVDTSAKEFDKDAFMKLKGEIKSRKAAKERLLSTGLPEFEAYLRFWMCWWIAQNVERMIWCKKVIAFDEINISYLTSKV